MTVHFYPEFFFKQRQIKCIKSLERIKLSLKKSAFNDAKVANCLFYQKILKTKYPTNDIDKQKCSLGH